MSTNSGSDRARRMAIRLLRWYPRPWRMRYEREMRALLAEMPVGWNQVGNLAITGVREWLSPRALGWPARSAAGRLYSIRLLKLLVYAYSLDAVARVIGLRLRSAGVEVTEWWQVAAAFLGAALGLRMCLVGMMRLGKARWTLRAQRRGWTFEMPEWELAVWALLIWPALVSFYAETPPDYLSRTSLQVRPYVHLIQIYVWTWFAFMSSARSQRLMRIQSAHLKRNRRMTVHTGFQRLDL